MKTNNVSIEQDGTEMELLWENPNPKAALPQQLIPVDTQKYDFILIICANGTTLVPVVGGDDPTEYTIPCVGAAQAGAYQSRPCFIKTTGVNIGRGSQPGVAYNDSYAVPLFMYGLKI